MIIHPMILPRLLIVSIMIVAGILKNFTPVLSTMAIVFIIMCFLFVVVIFSVVHRFSYRLASVLFYALVPLELTLKFGFLS